MDEITRLKASLSRKQEDVDLIQHQLDQLLSKHAEDINLRDQTISQLNCDLEAKACMIAFLTQQLHQTRTRLKKDSSSCVCLDCKALRQKAEQQTMPLREPKLGSKDQQNMTTSLVDLDSDPSSLSMLSTEAKKSASLSPFSPRPPSSSDGPNHRFVRRASTPMRRHSSSPRSLSDGNMDHTHHIHYRRPLKPACASRDPKVLPFELQQLLDSKEEATKLILRDSPRVLPPISSNQRILEEAYNPLSSMSDIDNVPQGYSPNIPSSRSKPRRLIMAQSQGLSSAPSTLRVLTYTTRTRQATQDLRQGVSDEGATVEGTLLVKESEEGGGGRSTTEWTPALD